jgi:predicted glutamine amidotransferase
MCGIFGFSRITDTTRRMAPFLALEMEGRGRDSWGATNGAEIIKHLGPIHKTWAESVPKWSIWSTGIFHTRAASTGAVSIKNQHPFITTKDTKVIIGIHNGVILNYDALNKKYNRTYECDSPHIFEAIVGNSPTQELQGYGNLAWYEMTAENPEPRLHLARFNGDNLNIAALESGEIVFCSTRGIVEQAASMAGGAVRTFYTTDEDMEYDIRLDETDPTQDCLWKIGKMPFGNRSYGGGSADFTSFWQTGHHRSSQGSQSSYRPVYPTLDQLNATDRGNNICGVSSCTEKVEPNRRRALVCQKHMDKFIKELVGVGV